MQENKTFWLNLGHMNGVHNLYSSVIKMDKSNVVIGLHSVVEVFQETLEVDQCRE